MIAHWWVACWSGAKHSGPMALYGRALLVRHEVPKGLFLLCGKQMGPMLYLEDGIMKLCCTQYSK